VLQAPIYESASHPANEIQDINQEVTDSRHVEVDYGCKQSCAK
jgi:hypothetical protein